MKTPVLYGRYGSAEIIRRTDHATFVPKGTRIGSNSDGTPWCEQFDSVNVPNGRYELGTDLVRVIPESYVDLLDEADRKIREADLERRDLIAEAFRRGRKIRKSDCQTIEERQALLTAKAVAS